MKEQFSRAAMLLGDAAMERLKNATKEQRDFFSLSFSGIHWPQLDEDLSFTGMFINSGLCSPSTPEEAYYYE